jgi:hypothetical protein
LAQVGQIQSVDGQALLRVVPNLPKSEVELFITLLEWGVTELLASCAPVTLAWARMGSAFSVAAGIPVVPTNPRSGFARLLQYWLRYTTRYVAALPYTIVGADLILYDEQRRYTQYALQNRAITLLAVTI